MEMGKIKVGDYVVVVDGDYKSLAGEVLAIYNKDGEDVYCIDSQQTTRDEAVVARKVVKYPEMLTEKMQEYMECRKKCDELREQYQKIHKSFLNQFEKQK